VARRRKYSGFEVSPMGFHIHYAFHGECPDDELLRRRRLRRKLQKLPFDSVSRVLRVNAAYFPLPLHMLIRHGYSLLPAVRRRLRGKLDTRHADRCFLAAPPGFVLVPDKLEHRFFQPAVAFAKGTPPWRNEDLPEKIGDEGSLTYFRMGFAVELAGVLLRHGYLIVVQPCEGCETFAIGLTRFRTAEPPCWLGSGFTKTQYATRFVEVHESICTALDYAREEGLLLAAEDTCKFYSHRDWSKSADIVNTATTFARVMGGLIDRAVDEAKKRGVPITDISDPATRNYNLVRFKPSAGSGRRPRREV
jgi:hypothetical protein